MSREHAGMRMEVKGFALDEDTKIPILLLQPPGRDEVLPIWIGPSEASAIALTLSGAEPQRPLTHDLIQRVLEGLDARLLRTEVTALEGNTFLGRLLLDRKGDFVAVDCRPSDGIALALRCGAEIYVPAELFEAQKKRLGPPSGGDDGPADAEDSDAADDDEDDD
ncbi:MAG: bifunctional nuclease family protein [Candidatus Krumholzibacteriia bacterium]|nr:bifunctional nuclease family protein [bacterium]